MHFTLAVLQNTRRFFKTYLETNSLEDLNKMPSGSNNNIVWNIGHIIVTQQLLAYKLSGLPMMISDVLIDTYKKGSKPEAPATQAEVDELKVLLFSTIEKTTNDYSNALFKNYETYTVSTTGNTLTTIDEAFLFIMFHEGMHLGYVMALLRAIKN